MKMELVKGMMPEYQCNRAVKAARIVGQVEPPVSQLELDTTQGRVWLELPGSFFVKNRPQTGHYLVEYEDGVLGTVPAEAFEHVFIRTDKSKAGAK